MNATRAPTTARDSAFDIEVIEVIEVIDADELDVASEVERNRDAAERLLAAVRARAPRATAAPSEAGTTSMPKRGIAQLDFLETRLASAVLKGALQEHGVSSLAELARRDVDAADVVIAKVERVRTLARHLKRQAFDAARARVGQDGAAGELDTPATHGSINASI